MTKTKAFLICFFTPIILMVVIWGVIYELNLSFFGAVVLFPYLSFIVIPFLVGKGFRKYGFYGSIVSFFTSVWLSDIFVAIMRQ